MIPYHSYLVIPYSYPIVIPKKHSQHCRSPDSSWLVDCSVRCPIPTASQPTSDISLLRRTSADKSFHHTVLRSHVCSLQTFEEGQCFETLMIYEYMNIYMYMYIWISARPWYFFHAKRLASTAEEPRNGWLSVKDQRIGRFSCKRIQDKRLGKRVGRCSGLKKPIRPAEYPMNVPYVPSRRLICIYNYIYIHKTHHLSILICLLVFIIDVTGNILMDRNNEYKHRP
jgi:hypothetical protein